MHSWAVVRASQTADAANKMKNMMLLALEYAR
jgi:hypothetical protein